MDVSGADVARALHDLGLAGRPVCLHASLRSFGRVAGGVPAMVRAFLDAGATLLVPTFTSRYAVRPPPGEMLARNAWPAESLPAVVPDPWSPWATEVDRDMGAIPAAVAAWPGRVRGDHPMDSFTAVGPLARELVEAQQPEDVYAPLRALAERGGSVILAGVGLERLTLLHLAESMAGRELFRRWAMVSGGRVVRAAVGGCSEGFGRLAPALAPLVRHARVGASPWMVLPAQETLARAAAAIRADPGITRCADPACDRCRDAIAGGPILPRLAG
ncbi:MAG TPA: AAC(3) family N-acetyltransferase [Longimicrobium sp.]|nr:AAC(3) family N-acetyltransferase [Longimicrobium sp.]